MQRFAKSHPRQWVDSSSSFYKRRPRSFFPNPPHGSVGIVQAQPTQAPPLPCPESHQRSWWIVHTRPTRRGAPYPFPESHQRRGCVKSPRIVQESKNRGIKMHRANAKNALQVKCEARVFLLKNLIDFSHSLAVGGWFKLNLQRASPPGLPPIPPTAVGG